MELKTMQEIGACAVFKFLVSSALQQWSTKPAFKGKNGLF
jgi:hypothetical protein